MTMLVCLHHAGGNPTVFRPWVVYAPAGITVVPITLPGRRAGEQPRRYHSLDELVPELAQAVRNEVGERDFVLFGKSMGGLLAYLLTRHLGADGGPAPRALAVASAGAPQVPWRDFTAGLDDQALVDCLHRMGGLPDWLAGHAKWVEPYLGRLREDARMCAALRLEPQKSALPMPVRVFIGDRDPLVPIQAAHRWRELGPDIEVSLLAGGHYLVSEDAGLLRQTVFKLALAG
ncbi:thioesterase II family protein [Nonomuraea candida]|uniref:thioesterase II family protein n=1 Tax=Nonomuraea candida TaxID=359159 RepID=UPI000694AEE8|nr:alpha/beta fold hydrolase [Nonomuraea candida]